MIDYSENTSKEDNENTSKEDNVWTKTIEGRNIDVH